MSEDRDLLAFSHRLQTALIRVKTLMKSLSYEAEASASEPVEYLAKVFGPTVDRSLLGQLFSRYRQGDFSDLPSVGVCSRADLQGSRAGYLSDRDMICVAEDFAAVSSEDEIVIVLLQEVFNAMEARVQDQSD